MSATVQETTAPKSGYSWTRGSVPRTATVPVRGAALFVDLVLLAGLTYGLWLFAGRWGFLPQAGGLQQYGFLLVMELPVGLLYFTLAEARWGRTVGKALVGVRVATTDGRRPSHYQAFLRNLLRFLWMTPLGPLFLLVDVGLIWGTEMEQRLGDVVGGTIVVDPRETEDAASVADAAPALRNR